MAGLVPCLLLLLSAAARGHDSSGSGAGPCIYDDDRVAGSIPEINDFNDGDIGNSNNMIELLQQAASERVSRLGKWGDPSPIINYNDRDNPAFTCETRSFPKTTSGNPMANLGDEDTELTVRWKGRFSLEELVRQYAAIADRILHASESDSDVKAKYRRYDVGLIPSLDDPPMSGSLAGFVNLVLGINEEARGRGWVPTAFRGPVLRNINPHINQLATVSLSEVPDNVMTMLALPHRDDIKREEGGDGMGVWFRNQEAPVDITTVDDRIDLSELRGNVARAKDKVTEAEKALEECARPEVRGDQIIVPVCPTQLDAHNTAIAELNAAQQELAEALESSGLSEDRLRALGRWEALGETIRSPDIWKGYLGTGAKNSIKGEKGWTVLKLFGEGGYFSGVERAGQGLNETSIEARFSCDLAVNNLGTVEWWTVEKWYDHYQDNTDLKDGEIENITAGNNSLPLRINVYDNLLTVGESIDSLWGALIKCLAVYSLYDPGAASWNSSPTFEQLQGLEKVNGGQGLETSSEAAGAIKTLLEANRDNIQKSGERIRENTPHFFPDSELADRGTIVCPGVFGPIQSDQNVANQHQIAPLCRYSFGTDFGSGIDFDRAPLSIANLGLWVNKTAMSGIVWITRQVYSFGLAEDAIGGMGAIFAPLNRWLVSPVGTSAGGGAGENSEISGPEGRLGEAARGTPRWLFWGFGIFLGLFTAYQVARGRHAVAAKEVLISVVAGSILFWMVTWEVTNPGSWYREVGGATTSAMRSVAALSFDTDANADELGEKLSYRIPQNYYPAATASVRFLRWLNGCKPPDFMDSEMDAEGNGWKSGNWHSKKREDAAWCVNPKIAGLSDHVGEDNEGDYILSAEEQRANWKSITSSRFAWPRRNSITGPGGETITKDDWPTDDDIWDKMADNARLEQRDSILGFTDLSSPIALSAGNRIADEIGRVLGTEVLSNMYYRFQWGYSLEGEKWKYCRERAWAAVNYPASKNDDAARDFFKGRFRHNPNWPGRDDPGTLDIKNYTSQGYMGALQDGQEEEFTEADGEGEDVLCGPGNKIKPISLSQYNERMPVERTFGPWVAAIPTVALFAAVMMNAVPVMVAQLLLVVLFALLPVIAFVAIMPGGLRRGLYKWVGHILRAVLTILFGVVFIVLSIWVLKGVYLVPGGGIWQDLFIGIAGAVAVIKLRGGLWRGATTIAQKAASGVGKLAGASGEVSFKGDKLGERFLRNAASTANKKRQAATARYEAGKGRVKGVGKMAKMAGMSVGSKLSPFQRQRHRNLKQKHEDARRDVDAASEFRKAVWGMSSEDYEKHRKDGFSALKNDSRYQRLFDEDGNMKNENFAKMNHGQAMEYSRDEEKMAMAKRTEARRERYAGRLGFRRANVKDMVAMYREEMEKARSKHRARLRAGAMAAEQVTFDLAEGPRGSSGGRTPKWEDSRDSGAGPQAKSGDGGPGDSAKGEPAAQEKTAAAQEDPIVVQAAPTIYVSTGSPDEMKEAKRVAEEAKRAARDQGRSGPGRGTSG